MLVATAAVGCAVVSAGCGGTTGGTAVKATAPKLIARPLVEREISGLLLSPDQVNAAVGVNNMAVTNTATSMADNAPIMTPPECLAIDGAAETRVYAGSGFVAERDQSLSDGDKLEHYVKQAVVLFPTADQARAFFTASAHQWPACHDFTHTQSQTHWTVGPIATTEDTMSTTATEEEASAPPAGPAAGRWSTATTSSSTSTPAPPTPPVTRRRRLPTRSRPTSPRSGDQSSPAATSGRSVTFGLSSQKPCSRHFVVNSASMTPSVRVRTSVDTCLSTNGASSGSTRAPRCRAVTRARSAR